MWFSIIYFTFISWYSFVKSNYLAILKYRFCGRPASFSLITDIYELASYSSNKCFFYFLPFKFLYYQPIFLESIYLHQLKLFVLEAQIFMMVIAGDSFKFWPKIFWHGPISFDSLLAFFTNFSRLTLYFPYQDLERLISLMIPGSF